MVRSTFPWMALNFRNVTDIDERARSVTRSTGLIMAGHLGPESESWVAARGAGFVSGAVRDGSGRCRGARGGAGPGPLGRVRVSVMSDLGSGEKQVGAGTPA